MNAEFFSVGVFFFFRGEALYLVVAQILILLLVWAQQRYAAHFTAVGAAFTLRRGSMLPEFYPLV